MITTGSIVRAPFSFLEDPSTTKTRYGLVMSCENYHTLFSKRRYLLAFISSSIPSKIHPEWEFLIEEGTENFKNSGLQTTSIVKAHRIIVVQEDAILEEVGYVPQNFVDKVRKCLLLF